MPNTPPQVHAPASIKRIRQRHHFVSADLAEVVTTVDLTLELRDVSLEDFLRLARAMINEHPINACIDLPQPELAMAMELIPLAKSGDDGAT